MRRTGCAILVALASAIGARAEGTSFRIAPGPQAMTAEEKELKPDPAAGAQHAIVLLEETERDDPLDGYAKTSYHFRAKIFSNEARRLADIVVPFEAKRGYLREWWGRTILPDGTVLELKKDELREQTIAREDRAEARVLKAVLPGVAPGCVIDFGYVFQDRSFKFFREIPLQRAWAVRHFRYRWLPAIGAPSQYYLKKRPGVDVQVVREKNAVVVEGNDLPPVPEEPWMPPASVVRAEALLYYSGFFLSKTNTDPNAYWKEVVRDEEERLTAFIKENGPFDDSIAAMKFTGDAKLLDKLRVAYTWLGAHRRNVLLGTSEESEADAEDDETDRKKSEALEPYEKRLLRPWAIAAEYVGIARVLGAEAHLILAPDRRDRYWDPGLLSEGQLDEYLVELRGPGDPDDRAIVVAPGWGLPFGVLPYWMAPSKGLLVTKEGGRDYVLRGADPRLNVLETKASISLDDPGEARASWTTTGAGQRGFREIRRLRISSPENRKKALDELCGASASLEVSKAAAPALDDVNAAYRLECEGRQSVPGAGEGREELPLHFDGAWIPEVPLFASPTRAFPIVFDYPWIDMASIEVVAPKGYAPAPAPPPVKLEAPFGSYALSVKATDRGYEIQRAFAMVSATLKPESYEALRKFLEDVRMADRTAVVFRRGQGEAR
ncbi:MAG: DUF3857 domain-containing protein [Acidobacteria bacterium]|nr:DUF3857 domain-containing protein [Acidobacteriota bacterium]